MLFNERINGLLTFKMAEIRHLENRQIAISQRKTINLDEIWYTNADLELDDNHMTKYGNF